MISSSSLGVSKQEAWSSPLGPQRSASSAHTRNPDPVCLEDAGGAVTDGDATGATGGQPAKYKQQAERERHSLALKR